MIVTIVIAVVSYFIVFGIVKWQRVKYLTKVRDDINFTTEQGKIRIERINAKIDRWNGRFNFHL